MQLVLEKVQHIINMDFLNECTLNNRLVGQLKGGYNRDPRMFS